MSCNGVTFLVVYYMISIVDDSFIHFEGFNVIPSRLLLRSAPDPTPAEKNGFKARVKRI